MRYGGRCLMAALWREASVRIESFYTTKKCVIGDPLSTVTSDADPSISFPLPLSATRFDLQPSASHPSPDIHC